MGGSQSKRDLETDYSEFESPGLTWASTLYRNRRRKGKKETELDLERLEFTAAVNSDVEDPRQVLFSDNNKFNHLQDLKADEIDDSESELEYFRKMTIFLVGPEGSGKTTLFKHMKMLYNQFQDELEKVEREKEDQKIREQQKLQPEQRSWSSTRSLLTLRKKRKSSARAEIMRIRSFDKSECKLYINIIHHNILHDLRELILDASTSKRLEDLPELVKNIHLKIEPQNAAAIKKLYQNTVGKLGEKADVKYNALKYFMNDDNWERIFAPKYLPSELDILHATTKTTGIISTKFFFNLSKPSQRKASKVEVQICDTSGASSERRKWLSSSTLTEFRLHSDLICLVFVADAPKENLKETLELFELVVNHKYYKDVPIVLLFTKTDLLQSSDTDLSGVRKKFMERIKSDRQDKDMICVQTANLLNQDATRKVLSDSLVYFEKFIDKDF